MKTIDANSVGQVWLDSPVLARARTPKHWTDWGDQETVGLHTKRGGKSFYDLRLGKDYGVFLGRHDIGYVIAIKSPDGSTFTGGEVFESLDVMKSEWVLD